MTTTFAERLRWSRYNGPAARKVNRVIGATVLSRRTDCSQSLISALERQDADGSEYNNKFADVLGVDRNWLATGEGLAPEGFSEAEAKEMLRRGGDRLLSIVHSQRHPAESPRRFGVAHEAPSRLAQLQRSIVSAFMEFGELAGTVRAKALAKLLEHVAESQMTSADDVARENQS